MDTVFKTADTSVMESVDESNIAVPNNEPATGKETTVEPLFTEYQKEKGKPYTAEYFDIGVGWDEDGVFAEEIKEIETHFKRLIEGGEINNDKKAVEILLKRYEKMAGVDPTERPVSKIGKILEYTRFLEKTKNI